MTQPDLEQLRELLAKATPRPWRGVPADDYEIVAAAYPNKYAGRFPSDDTGSSLAVFGNRPSDHGEANRDLAVEAVNALQPLLDTIEALIKERDEARAAIERVRAVIEQGYPKPASKHDVCEHGRSGSEDCIACYDIALVQALSIGGEG